MEVIPFVTSRNKTSRIDDLPSEVLSEVASNLDFIDILSLQQTNKKLRKSTEAHAVWLALAKKYSAQHFNLYCPETGPFDTLNTDELCAWTRKRLAVDHIWRARHAQPHFRSITVDSKETFALKLVPGTRWLLLGSKDGSVYYYDLDSEDLKPSPLTRPSGMIVDGVFECVHSLEVHVDEGAPRLEFKLVVHRIPLYSATGFPLQVAPGAYHVWQVKLEDDGSSLTAEFLNSMYGYAFIDALALGPHLVACAKSSIVGPSMIEVIRWEQDSATRDPPIHFATGDARIEKLHLLDNDKVLSISRESVVNLYALPGSNRTSPNISLFPTSFAPGAELIWSHSLTGGTYKCSSPLWYNGTTYRLAVNVGDRIWGLIFPAMSDDDPSVVELSDIPRQRNICVVGVFRAYAFDEGETGVRIGYSWDDGDSVPTIRQSEEKRNGIALRGQYPAFDEQAGRFVYLASENIVVGDYFPKFNTTS